MKRIIFTCLLSVILFSCSFGDDEFTYLTKDLLPIDEIVLPDSFNYEEQYTITFKYTLPRECYYYNSLYYSVKDSTRTLAVEAVVDMTDDACEEVAEQLEGEFILTAAQTEDYIFKIWKGKDENDENIYEEVIVPVLEPGEQL